MREGMAKRREIERVNEYGYIDGMYLLPQTLQACDPDSHCNQHHGKHQSASASALALVCCRTRRSAWR